MATDIILLAMVALLHLAMPSSCHQTTTRTLCVTTDNCTAIPFNCTKCQPLSAYTQKVRNFFTNNTEMVFTAGTHRLYLPPDGTPVVNITGVANFSMIGLGKVSNSSSEEGAPQPGSIISCSNQNRSGILFYKSNTIHIENLTVEDCGAEFTFHGPDNFTVVSALAFRESHDIKLTRLRMNRNVGYGLHADRIFGNLTVTNSAFLRCKPYKLNKEHTIGGNARFWYSFYHIPDTETDKHTQLKTTLKIEHSWFLFGPSIHDRFGTLPGGGGLSILIYLPNTTVVIDDIKAMHNSGNVAISVTDFRENTSTITIRNSVIANGSATRGGGLRFWVRIDKKRSKSSTGAYTSHNMVTILNTEFVNNTAKDTGGGVYISHYERNSIDSIHRYIKFRSCRFIGNSIIHKKFGRSYTGAAIQVLKHKIADNTPHTVPQFTLYFRNCVFAYNKLNEVKNEGGIVDFVSTNGIVIEESNFTSNEGTAISLRNSNVQFGGRIVFKNNIATHGGALKFCQFSKMYLPVTDPALHIDFINNSASSMGGAIYVAQEQCVETAPPCFFQPVVHKNVTLENMNVTLRFQNNSAKLAGDAVYGGQVDHCYMTYYFRKDNVTYWSHNVFNRIFDLAEQSNDTRSTVSSAPYGGCFCNTSDGIRDSLQCHDITYPRIVIPGQTISLGVSAIGQRSGTVPITSAYFEFSNAHINSQHNNTTQLIINDPQLNRHQTRCNILNCTVYSNRTSAVFKLTIAQQTSQTELRYIHYNPPHLKILIGKCPWGFTLSKHPPYKCTCDDMLTAISISCNVDAQTVTRPGGLSYWVGCSSYQNDVCKGISVAKRCSLGYCKTEVTSISPGTLDNQCSEGREGVLCGRCKQGYSLALGTSRCLPSCPSYMVYIVIVVCAASGILLVLFLIACNFTISEGTVNGLLFYAHMVHKNATSFFPGSAGASNTNILRLFIAWLNLDLGFEVCFYKSMTQYQKTWIQFGFLFYIWVLVFFIIVLSRRYIFFTRLVGRNIVNVMATLFLICYAKMINIAIVSLEFALIRHSDGPATTVWLFDGILNYLTGKHIPLFVLGTIFCCLASMYTLILLFIQCLQKRSNFCCLWWVERLRPFFEAYTGPCRVNYRFWPGLLFFARLTLFTFYSLFRDKPATSLHITVTACVVILVFAFVSPNGVYKCWLLNVLEFSFFVNLGAVSGLVALFCRTQSATSSGPRAAYFVYPSVAIVMILFACILSFHCVKQLLSHRCCQRLTHLVATRRAILYGFNRMNIQREIRDEEEERPFLRQHIMPQITRYNHYREPLIEDDQQN